NLAKSGQRYDMVFDCAANESLSAFRGVLSPKGNYIIVGAADARGGWMIGMIARLLGAMVLSWFSSKKLVMGGARISKEDLKTLGGLMETGKVIPVIDRRYALHELPEAIRYVETGHARGKSVITVD